MGMVKEMQLGKNGITEGFMDSLKNHFVKSQNVRISVLRSFCRDKKELEKIKNEILDKLGKNYTARTIGYTIALKKWRRSKEEQLSSKIISVKKLDD